MARVSLCERVAHGPRACRHGQRRGEIVGLLPALSSHCMRQQLPTQSESLRRTEPSNGSTTRAWARAAALKRLLHRRWVDGRPHHGQTIADLAGGTEDHQLRVAAPARPMASSMKTTVRGPRAGSIRLDNTAHRHQWHGIMLPCSGVTRKLWARAAGRSAQSLARTAGEPRGRTLSIIGQMRQRGCSRHSSPSPQAVAAPTNAEWE